MRYLDLVRKHFRHLGIPGNNIRVGYIPDQHEFTFRERLYETDHVVRSALEYLGQRCKIDRTEVEAPWRVVIVDELDVFPGALSYR